MTYREVLIAYRDVLLANPGKALKIGPDAYAVIDATVCWTTASSEGKPDLNAISDFDPSAFIECEGRWDCDESSAVTMGYINDPTFVDI